MVDKGRLFKKAKYKKYKNIVSFKDINSAKKSADKLANEFANAKTKSKRLRIAKIANYASNRAMASSKRKNLSKKEREELVEISNVYRILSDSLFLLYRKE